MKGLEALEKLKIDLEEHYLSDSAKDIQYNIIEKDLKEYELLKEDIKKCSCWKEHKALEIIKECFVSEFKLFEKYDEYYILFYFDEIHELTFKLKSKEEYDLLKEVLL